MYSRKIKQMKKKLKTGPTQPNPSNWGPRLALEEQQQTKISYGRSVNETSPPISIFKNPYTNNVVYQSKFGKLGNGESSERNERRKDSTTLQQPKKPLTVILPNQKLSPTRYDYAYQRDNNNGGDNVKQNNAHRPNRHSYDSLPSTETWQSSDDDSEGKLQQTTKGVNEPRVKTSLTSKSDIENIHFPQPRPPHPQITSLPKDSEILEGPISKWKSKSIGNELTYEETRLDLESESSLESNCSRRSREGQAVHHAEVHTTGNIQSASGITMVYVPMERGGTKAKLLTRSREAIGHGHHHHQDDREPISFSQIQGHQPSSQRKSSGINKCSTQLGFDGKDPDGDSLLESFDSILFKPNPNTGHSTSSASSSGMSSNCLDNQNQKVKGERNGLICKSGYVAPPLSQKNSYNLLTNKKNLRFSDHLDVKSTSPLPFPSIFVPSNQKNRNKSNYCKCKGQSTSTFMTSPILPCGHEAIHDNYSTISSIDSQFHNEQEEDTESRHSAFKSASEKSALQQLRDLSILIGGSFHRPLEDAENERAVAGGQKLLKSSPPLDGGDTCSKLRKTSTTTTSGDSGKGTDSTQTQSASNRSSTSPGDCEDSCIFHPNCHECLTLSFLQHPYNQFQRQSTTTTSSEQNLTSIELPIVTLSKKPKILRRKSNKFIKNSKTKLKLKFNSRKNNNSIETLKNENNVMSKNGIGRTINCDCNCNCPVTLSHSTITKSELILGRSDVVNSSSGGGGSGKRRQIDIGKESPGGISSTSSGNVSMDPHLFTIAEEDERNDYGGGIRSSGDTTENEFHNNHNNNETSRREKTHSHPKCWLAPDPTMGWSDLESLYSQNLKRDTPLEISGECLTCLKELSEYKRNSLNTTIDRTKRMFIWLNKRPKEFAAPWWEAKKQASIKWILVKALKSQVKDSPHLNPFRESKKDKTKMRLKDEMIRDMTTGKLYTMALNNLFHSSDPPLYQQLTTHLRRGEKLNLWDIIKILARKGVYVAEPSDMKLTEGTLRQKKPLRIAAHIALVEAIMGLYAKELISRERVITILNSFGHTLRADAHRPEQLVISWINSAITTLKAYILSTNQINNTSPNPLARHHRWLNVSLVSEIRDLSDGVGISALFALYFSTDLRLDEIAVPEPGEVLNIYETMLNHAMIQKLCMEFFPEKIYHLSVSDFLYIHGYMKQNILAFLIDLFMHLEVNPIVRVNRLTHVPLRVEL